MTSALLHDGRFHAGFFVFVRGLEGSDADVLARFGITEAQRLPSAARPREPYLAIWQTGAWTVLADDWAYTLYHGPATRPAIAELVQQHDVLTCSEGECDESFEYQYFVNGALVRDYEVSSPAYTDRNVVRDVGALLPGEREVLQANGNYIGLAVARLIGIATHVTPDLLRVYQLPRSSLRF